VVGMDLAPYQNRGCKLSECNCEPSVFVTILGVSRMRTTAEASSIPPRILVAESARLTCTRCHLKLSKKTNSEVVQQ